MISKVLTVLLMCCSVVGFSDEIDANVDAPLTEQEAAECPFAIVMADLAKAEYDYLNGQYWALCFPLPEDPTDQAMCSDLNHQVGNASWYHTYWEKKVRKCARFGGLEISDQGQNQTFFPDSE